MYTGGTGDVTDLPLTPTIEPYPLGTRKMTVHKWKNNADKVTGEYYSDTAHASDFLAEWNRDGKNKAWYMVGFNIWGLGGDEAERWGEDKLYDPEDPTSPKKWSASYGSTYGSLQWSLNIPNRFLGRTNKTWKFVRKHGIKLRGGGINHHFSFMANLSDPTLNVWFGGTLMNKKTMTSAKHKWIKYQGNLQLTGTPVPEPGTFLLLGFGLIAIGGLSFCRKRV